jgi:hypothetical protein
MQMTWMIGIVFGGSIAVAADAGADDKKAAALKPHKPVVCEKNEKVTLDGVLIETKDIAVLVGTNCKLAITNSKIVSTGNFAMSFGGSSRVTLTNVEVIGKWAAVTSGGSTDVTIKGSTLRGPFSVGGSATVRLSGSNVHGPKSVTASARFVDEGGNKFHDK